MDQAGGFRVDALKRRYQVFVSSTYEDLKEERQHVIQALLERSAFRWGWNYSRLQASNNGNL